MSINTKVENYLNYVTGSAGGWPSNTNIGILAGIDYLIETGSNNIYFTEMNTNIGILGSLSQQQTQFNLVSDYANEKGCTTAYVYGTNDRKVNPSTFQQSIISSSFARHNISSSFQYNDDISHAYFFQRGENQYTGSFHLFIQTPWYSDDTLLNIVSGSFNKSSFRNILSSSPESASLIPLFDKDNYTNDSNFPDYVIKLPTAHSSISSGNLGLKTYQSGTSTYQDAVDSGSIAEKFIVSSGSYVNDKSYLFQSKIEYLLTPDKLIKLSEKDGNYNRLSTQMISSGSENWYLTPQSGLVSTASGSLINMYDGSTKQVQDVEVGDVVKSYQPLNMPDESQGMSWADYTTTDLSGSFASGSIVVNVRTTDVYGYYLINNSIKLAANLQTMLEGVRYFVKDGGTWQWKQPSSIQVGDYLLNNDGSELEITTKTEVAQEETFYGLNVEDIDTYFQSNILVHNIPGKCFVAGTPIIMGDGTEKNIEDIEVGDVVKTYNFEDEEVNENKVVEIETPTHADLIEIEFEDRKNKNTFDHPYWVVGKGWCSYKPEWTKERYELGTNQLEVGDICMNQHKDEDGNFGEVKIISITEDVSPVQTYSLTIDSNKNYFANGVLVHNKLI